MMTDITSQVDLWVQRLRAIAMTGLAFEPLLYDRERYEEILNLAASMAATTAALQTDEQLSHELYEHWRAEVGKREHGYVTPKVGVGAVVFNERDELLLIKRATTKNWLYPTGWADVGYVPAQVAAKEVREETGLRVTPLRLIAVYDSSRRSRPTIGVHFWSLTFYCRLDGGAFQAHPLEVVDLGFFAREHLPDPLARQGEQWIEHVFAAHHGELKEPYFDWP
jgi:ADP-ribose pyrophosphatase YjhB (NUDIX family)